MFRKMINKKSVIGYILIDVKMFIIHNVFIKKKWQIFISFTLKLLFQSDLYITVQVIYVIKMVFF